jgi:hypothetical protein
MSRTECPLVTLVVLSFNQEHFAEEAVLGAFE